jgi:hypothetical protein
MITHSHIKTWIIRQQQQCGVVLVIALVFLIALTLVTTALMQNSILDMKMSGASQAKMLVNQEVISAVDEFIFRQVSAKTGENGFAQPSFTFQSGPKNIISELTYTNKAGDIDSATLTLLENQFQLNADCPHSQFASSTQLLTCQLLLIKIRKKYGRNNTSIIQVNSGIVQQLLK